MKINEISGELINRAVSIYIEHAYRRHTERRQNVVRFEPDQKLTAILSGKHPFEDLTGGTPASLAPNPVPLAGGTPPRVYALRLGNDAYPHMKLALVEVYFQDEMVFAVDRHDTFHFEPDVPGFQAWCELKEINRILKDSIEASWHKAGIPTLRGLREQRFRRPDLVRELRAEGHTILILDDDEARGEILRGILATDGYDAVVGPPGPKPVLATEGSGAEGARGGVARRATSAAPGTDDVAELAAMIRARRVALIVLDVSYRTGQGPRVANALRLNSFTQDVPVLAVYSRRDFGPDPDLFDASLRRPYRTEAILALVEQTLVRRSRGASGIHPAIPDTR